MLNIKPTDRVRLVGVVDPDVLTIGDHSTGWIKAADFHNFMAAVYAGTLGTSATFDAKIEEAQDGSGTAAQDLTDKAISQLTQAGTNDSDKQAFINLRPEELSDDFTHFRLTVSVGTASSDGGAAVFGFDARYEPEDDLTSVAEIVD